MPVVASDAGAYAEMIAPGRPAQSFRPATAQALTAAIEPYLAEPTACATQGRNGPAHVRRHFALQREADALIAVYEGLWARQAQ